MKTEKHQNTKMYTSLDDTLEGQIYEIESFSDNYSFWPRISEKCKDTSKSYNNLMQWKAGDNSDEIADVSAMEKFRIDFIKAYNLGKSVKALEEITNKYDLAIDFTESQFWTYIQESIANGKDNYLNLLDEEELYKKDLKKIFDIGLQNSAYQKNLESEIEKLKKKLEITIKNRVLLKN